MKWNAQLKLVSPTPARRQISSSEFYSYIFLDILKSVGNLYGHFLNKKSAGAVSAIQALAICHLTILFNLTQKNNSSCV